MRTPITGRVSSPRVSELVLTKCWKALLALAAAFALFSSGASAAVAPGIAVAGRQLVDGSGAPLRIAGVNRSGSEYACAQGWGMFDGPTDDASIAAMTSWGVNAVRVPLNEDCWLGINGVNPAYAGANYRSAIRAYVNRLQAHGLDVILDLHWGAPGKQLALGQEQAPDADHAPAFWSSVAAQYKGVRGIAFDLFNEPHDISWSCWLGGCTTPAGWKAAGMQQLIHAVRNAGATQPVIVEGLAWGGDLSGWLANKPSDPARQLAAGWHVYNFSGCNSTACWDNTVAPVAGQVPVVATEIGEGDCAGGFLNTLLPWADSHHVGYLAWAWNAASCGGGPSLISNYSGAPTAYGAAYRTYISASHRRLRLGRAAGTRSHPRAHRARAASTRRHHSLRANSSAAEASGDSHRDLGASCRSRSSRADLGAGLPYRGRRIRSLRLDDDGSALRSAQERGSRRTRLAWLGTAILGNVVGGVLIVAVVNYGQVRAGED